VRFAAVTPPGTTLEFSWDLEGRGRYSALTHLPSTTHVFRRPGTFVVRLLALALDGGKTLAQLDVVVLAPHPHATRDQAGVRRAPTRSPVAHAAAGASVSIKDFSFGPSTITVHAGDTVTWVNEGPSNHTATAAGMFDTGVLHAGQSASLVFTHVGTFSYRCSIHPFMRGTVTVLAASSSSATPVPSNRGGGNGGASSAPTQASGASGAASSARGQTLPNTGSDARTEVIAGLAMLVLGTALLLGPARRGPTRARDGGRESRNPPPAAAHAERSPDCSADNPSRGRRSMRAVVMPDRRARGPAAGGRADARAG
jgi:LPXTG-motif cell wall-anchored protein